MSSRLFTVSSRPLEEIIGTDLILPCQYYDVSGGHRLTGEQRLMLALLTDAINVYQKGALSRMTNARRLYVDAEQWILADKTVGSALSFNTVCEAIGINAPVLRRRIIDWKHTVGRQRKDHPDLPHIHLKLTPRSRHASHQRGRPASVPATIPAGAAIGASAQDHARMSKRPGVSAL
jgi:hypothetical protein